MERKWKLGEDLDVKDNMLDGFTFEDLIKAVKASCKRYSEKEVKKQLDLIVSQRMQDLKELYSNNVNEIIAEVIGDANLNMSFYEGTIVRSIAKDRIAKTSKKLVYTYGFEYRHPTTHRVPITKERAFEIIDTEAYLDVHEDDECIHLNAFSDNDMW